MAKVKGNPNCTKCKLHRGVHPDRVCVMGHGPRDAEVMVVSKMHNSGTYQKLIESSLEEAGLDPKKVYYTAALKCKDYEVSSGTAQVKQCQEYLDQEIAKVKPKWILAFGNEGLYATTKHSGITKYRTQVIEKNGHNVVATVSPAAVNRNPGQKAGWLADLKYFGAQVKGKTGTVELPAMAFIDTKKKFEQLKKLLARTRVLSYDVETTGFNEFDSNSAIVSLAGTCETFDGQVIVWAIPLFHPKSVFRSTWQKVLRILAKYIRHIPIQVAHNGKFDARWGRRFGLWFKVTFDTMMACHLLNENELKGLKPQATARFGVGDWGIDTRNLLNEPIRKVLVYNAKDTFYTYWIYKETRGELLEKPRLLRLFKLLTMPALEILIEAERRGIWIDRQKLSTAIKISSDMRDEIEAKIMEYVPPEDQWPLDRRGRPRALNFNASIWLRWFLFTHLELPVIARGKPKETADGESPGDPSVAEAVMLELRQAHPVVNLLLDRSKWQKYSSSFLPAYDELADENDRIHTTFKLAGTVTGRLSSGKEDAEKVSARVDNRGVNIQQVPRDPFVRGLFGAQPGFTIVEIDFSQVELRVVAFKSRDRTMLHLYRTGQDIHLATASWVMGVPSSQVTKEDRKKAKAVNFGFVYGMGPAKFVITAFEKYELVFTLDEAKGIRRLFFEQFTGLFPWHNRQRRLVAQNGRVESPMGRVRNLPDIYSEEAGVRAEAERQAINSPVQAFASDMNLLAMIEAHNAFGHRGLEAYALGTIHDATLWEIRNDHLAEALPLLKTTYENLPLEKKFGVHLDVPIIADVKIGTHWGEAQELSEWEVYNYADIPF